jgi:TatA/E family protein of Tat protein translocase
MPTIGATELIIVLVLVLLVFGAGKLSDVGSALGRSIRDVRASAKESEPTADSQARPQG